MHKQVQIYFFVFILLVVAGASVTLLLPYLQALLLAAAFAVIFNPIYKWQLRVLNGSKGLAAFITMIIAVSAVLIPVMIVGFFIFTDALQMVKSLRTIGSPDDILINLLHQVMPNLAGDLVDYARQVSSEIANQLAGFLGGLVKASVSSALGLLAFFYFLKDGEQFTNLLVRLSPLEDKHDRKILDRLQIAIMSVVQGTVIIAIVQGILAGFGLLIFGVPSPTVWGSVAAIAAMVPTVGTALVMGPAVLYLVIIGQSFKALGLAIWAVAIVGSIDNVLKPYLIGRGVNLHPLLILLSVLGGLQWFGPIGFLLGPLILSLLFALFDLYPVIVEGHAEKISTRKKTA